MNNVVETMTKAKILVVDDETNVRELMSDVLEDDGYRVVSACDGREGLKAFFSWRPSLVVLDILMPSMNGWQLLERIREVSETSVIILTALGSELDTVRGLRSGADDYMFKPVRTSEFLARVEATLRKTNLSTEVIEEYQDAVLHVDFKRYQVCLDGVEIQLSPQEFRLLGTLVRNANTVLSTDRLLELCWGEVGGPENVRVYVGYLRKKLHDDSKRPQLVETVREFGYRYRRPDDRASH